MKHLIIHVNIAGMNNQITFVKEIRILREPADPGLMAIKAKGIATLKSLIAPVLIPRNYEKEPADGILELDFTLDETHTDLVDVELEVEVVFRIDNLPDWVKGVKVNAAENSDIELV
jgi:hypothetical protein